MHGVHLLYRVHPHTGPNVLQVVRSVPFQLSPHPCPSMSPFHEDDSIFNLLADSPDPQQPMIVESSSDEWCPDTLVDSGDDFLDTVVQSEDGSDEEEDSPAVGNGHWFKLSHATSQHGLPVALSPQPPPTAHSLCELWCQPTMCEDEVPPEESPFDSQCTANDNPGLPDSALPMPLAPHFTRDNTFWDSAWEFIKEYTEWFETSACLHNIMRNGPQWEQNCDVVTGAIEYIVSTKNEFKIGITCDPQHRFWECDGGEYSKRYRIMTIVYIAPFSDPCKLHSTGMMEREQITKFKHYGGCLNKARGGEGASRGSPHFLYVVWN